ncbi:MAG: pilus assembly protein PilP [Myxococcaceae bacterium]|nr:pilus assembly protein PilP [Myxococcaceae bacterium]
MRAALGTVCIVAFGLVACGESPAPTAPAVTPPAARPRPAVADAGVAAPSETYQYSYSAMGKRDPFRSLGNQVERGSGGDIGSGQAPCDEVLCQFDLDDLKLVAVVSGDANPVAMVEDRAGVGHVVRRNTKMGRQAGKVTAILRDCIVVTSFVPGPDGRQQANRESLCVSTEGALTPQLDLMNGKPRE